MSDADGVPTDRLSELIREVMGRIAGATNAWVKARAAAGETSDGALESICIHSAGRLLMSTFTIEDILQPDGIERLYRALDSVELETGPIPEQLTKFKA